MTSSTGTTRVVALVDMDCFYVQVEEKDDPSIKGIPAAVVQYKTYKGGGIIAVNYEARARGVSRNMRGDDAKAVCPEIVLVRVPETRGKADLTKYRDAGRDVIQVLSEFSSCVERASIDEAYIDLSSVVEEKMNQIYGSQDMFAECDTKDVLNRLNMEHLNTNYVLGYESTDSWLEMMKESEMTPTDDVKLAVGAQIVGEMREAVFQKTGFRCSAGIAHNKVLAKLVCGINKPNKQTVLPHSSVPELWSATKLKKVRNLGGKLGDYLVEKLNCEMMSDLTRYSEKDLTSHLGSKTGTWIYHLARGYDDEPVNPRQLPKSIGCNKNFFGPEALVTKDKTKFWISQLSAEVTERIQKDYEVNNRRAKTLTLHVLFNEQNALSRACKMNQQYILERISADAYAMMEKLYQTFGVLPINSLGLIASKFEEEMDTSCYAKISSFFTNGRDKPTASTAAASTSTATSSNSILPLQASKGMDGSNSESESSSKALTMSSLAPLSEANTNPKPTTEETKTNDSAPTSTKRFFVFSSAPPESAIASLKSPKKSPRKPVPQHLMDASAVPSTSSSPVKIPLAMKQECERCGKTVPLLEYVTHMDRHFAKDLSREINGLPPLGFDLRPETLERLEREREKESSPSKRTTGGKRPRGRGSSSSAAGSKRGRPANKTTSTAQPVKTLDSYFTRKS